MLEGKKWYWKLPYEIHYFLKYFRVTFNIIYFKILQWFIRRMFKTYPLIHDCGRCEDCGRNVHDYIVPDDVWIKVYGSDGGILCYDCFCDRADRKFGVKWRIKFCDYGSL